MAKSLYLMKNIFGSGVVLAALTLISISQPAWSQITLLSATPCGPAAFPTVTCAIPATSSGNLVVVGWISEAGAGSTSITSVKDNATGNGNNYIRIPNARSVDSAANTMTEIWYARNIRAGGSILTITPSSAGTRGTAVIWQFTGADTSAPLGQISVMNNQPASAVPAGAAITTTTNREVVISIANTQGIATGIATGNLFTAPSTVNGKGWAHRLTSSAGAYAARWTTSSAKTYSASTVSFKSAPTGTALNACDLTQDGALNSNDVTAATNMVLGTRACTANILGAGICNAGVVQRVVNAAVLGDTCMTATTPPVTPRSVALSWTASTSTNIGGYRIHRATTSGGPYSALNSTLVAGTSYTDTSVTVGQTYYYVVSAVTTSNVSSIFSNEVQAVITPR